MTTQPNDSSPPPRPQSSKTERLLERLPPTDAAAEMALIGSMLVDPEIIGNVAGIVSDERQFARPENGLLYRILIELSQNNQPIDGLLVTSYLEKQNLLSASGGLTHIEACLNTVPSSANWQGYAEIVAEKSLLRNIIRACTDTLQDVYDSGEDAKQIVDRAEQRIFDVAQEKNTHEAVALSTVMEQIQEVIDKQSGDQYTGLATGYTELDNLTSGFQKGEMLILAARPSVGKTALAMNIVENVGINDQKPVLVFSLEMSSQQLAQRMLCARSGVDGHRLRRGILSREERHGLGDAMATLSTGKIFIDDTPSISLMDIRTKARRMKKEHDIELIVIDYLQLVESPRAENRQQQIGAISRGIKALARELNVPILALSQLNRASESESRLPRTSDLRESGSIEQDADVVMLLHREAVMHRGDEEWKQANQDKLNEALLIIAKQRNGPCDTVSLTFLEGSTRFENRTNNYGG